MTIGRGAVKYRNRPKRALDVVGSATLIVLTSPLLLAIALGVRWKMGSPVIFSQRRTGFQEQNFRIFKFRTMTSEIDADGVLLADSQRLTPFGSWLRSTSLDELPELYNVLRGEMSLVGPRPLPTHYTPFFTQAERVRFEVRPGMTGIAQTEGRNDLSWSQRFAADVRYSDDCSLGLDAAILLKTLFAVANRSGLHINPGAVTPDLDVERSELVADTLPVSLTADGALRIPPSGTR